MSALPTTKRQRMQAAAVDPAHVLAKCDPATNHVNDRYANVQAAVRAGNMEALLLLAHGDPSKCVRAAAVTALGRHSSVPADALTELLDTLGGPLRRHLLRLLAKGKNWCVADQLVTRLALDPANAAEAARVLQYASPAVVADHLDTLPASANAFPWARLAKWHPSLVGAAVRARLATGESFGHLRWVLQGMAGVDPDAAGDLAAAAWATGRVPLDSVFCDALLCRTALCLRVMDKVALGSKDGAAVANWLWTRSTMDGGAKLADEPLAVLLNRGWLSVDDVVGKLRVLPWALLDEAVQREARTVFLRGATDPDGVVPVAVVSGMPREERYALVRQALAGLPVVATTSASGPVWAATRRRPIRDVLIGLLGLEEACRAGLLAESLVDRDVEVRAAAAGAMVACGRNAAEYGPVLEAAIVRMRDCREVRAAVVTGLANLPAKRWVASNMAALEQFLEMALRGGVDDTQADLVNVLQLVMRVASKTPDAALRTWCLRNWGPTTFFTAILEGPGGGRLSNDLLAKYGGWFDARAAPEVELVFGPVAHAAAAAGNAALALMYCSLVQADALATCAPTLFAVAHGIAVGPEDEPRRTAVSTDHDALASWKQRMNTRVRALWLVARASPKCLHRLAPLLVAKDPAWLVVKEVRTRIYKACVELLDPYLDGSNGFADACLASDERAVKNLCLVPSRKFALGLTPDRLQAYTAWLEAKVSGAPSKVTLLRVLRRMRVLPGPPPALCVQMVQELAEAGEAAKAARAEARAAKAAAADAGDADDAGDDADDAGDAEEPFYDSDDDDTGDFGGHAAGYVGGYDDDRSDGDDDARVTEDVVLAEMDHDQDMLECKVTWSKKPTLDAGLVALRLLGAADDVTTVPVVPLLLRVLNNRDARNTAASALCRVFVGAPQDVVAQFVGGASRHSVPMVRALVHLAAWALRGARAATTLLAMVAPGVPFGDVASVQVAVGRALYAHVNLPEVREYLQGLAACDTPALIKVAAQVPWGRAGAEAWAMDLVAGCIRQTKAPEVADAAVVAACQNASTNLTPALVEALEQVLWAPEGATPALAEVVSRQRKRAAQALVNGMRNDPHATARLAGLFQEAMKPGKRTVLGLLVDMMAAKVSCPASVEGVRAVLGVLASDATTTVKQLDICFRSGRPAEGLALVEQWAAPGCELLHHDTMHAVLDHVACAKDGVTQELFDTWCDRLLGSGDARLRRIGLELLCVHGDNTKWLDGALMAKRRACTTDPHPMVVAAAQLLDEEEFKEGQEAALTGRAALLRRASERRATRYSKRMKKSLRARRAVKRTRKDVWQALSLFSIY
jgi:hypothetical protein